MSPTLVPFMYKFFVIGGLILVLSGAAQWWLRRRDSDETLVQALGSRATLKMIVFVSAGLFFTLVGLHVIPFPHMR